MSSQRKLMCGTFQLLYPRLLTLQFKIKDMVHNKGYGSMDLLLELLLELLLVLLLLLLYVLIT